MKTKSNKLLLTLTAILLTISFVATPVTALVPITTSDPAIENIETPSSDTAIFEEAGSSKESNTRSTSEIVTSTYLEDGVYAFRNIGNGNLWMDLERNIVSYSVHMQQCYYATPPTESFERAALFKVTRVGSTNQYIIRLMMNNLLTFGLSNGEYMTKRISADDSQVSASSTFVIQYSTNGYTIRQYGYTNYVCANHTQASGYYEQPESLLIPYNNPDENNCGKWEIHKYTGSDSSGVLTTTTSITENGLRVEETQSVYVCSWSTIIGANTPLLEVSSSTASRISITTFPSTMDFRIHYDIRGAKAGEFQLIYRILKSDGMMVYQTRATHIVTPVLNAASYYIQNAATGKYMDIEGPSTADGAYIQQWAFSIAPQKQWTLVPVGGGYYAIKSNFSNKYVGVDSSNPTLVKQYSTLNNYTTWLFREKNSGYYQLANKARGVANALAAQSDTSGDGSDLRMTSYTDDTSYRDEWKVDSYDITFYGITNSGHNHSTCLENVETSFSNYGFNNITIKTGAISSSQCLTDLKNSNIFTSRSHGEFVFPQGTNTIVGTGIILNDTFDEQMVGLYSQSFNGMTDGSTAISSNDSFSGVNIALFIGCYTAYGRASRNNLVTVVVNSGAEVAIGFHKSIGCREANAWTESLYSYLLNGATVREAVNAALENCEEDSGLQSVVVFGNENYKIN